MALWTDDDLLTALQMRDDGLSYAEITTRLDRTTAAVETQLGLVRRELAASELER